MPQIFPMNWFLLSIFSIIVIFSPEKFFLLNSKNFYNKKKFLTMILIWKW